MKTILEINEQILAITNTIREKYPELLEQLNEMPITVPYQENPEITINTLTSYHESLVVLVQGYTKNNTQNMHSLTNDILPVTEIITMETDNAYQHLMTTINNLTLSYYDVGEGKTPIIFLHGFPFDKSMWKGQLDALKSSYRLIACDIRGFGKSTDEKSVLSIDLFGTDIIAFMDKLNINKAIICGLSMGGFIALNMVKRFPERFEALILCDTQCIADTAEVKENRYKTIEQINQEDASAFNEKFTKSVFHPNSLTDKTELVDSLRSIVFANTKEIIMAGLIALAERSETCSSLAAINIPTLILCGSDDAVTPLVQSEFMHLHIEGSILKIMHHAGHVSNLEQPEAFNKHLLEFLQSLAS